MQNALTAVVALAGLFFSLSCALLLEELLFGVVFRLMACSRQIGAALQARNIQQVPVVTRQGERPCSH
jgi:hypothetical protein